MIEKGIYEHYKGHKYQVLELGLFESTLEPMVVYQAMYDNKVSKVWIRPEVDFTGMVEVDGQLIPRFKKVS